MKKSIIFCVFILLFSFAFELNAKSNESFSADADSVEQFVPEQGEDLEFDQDGDESYFDDYDLDEEDDTEPGWKYSPFFEGLFPSVVV